jgi:hypothetical protein
MFPDSFFIAVIPVRDNVSKKTGLWGVDSIKMERELLTGAANFVQ